MNKEVIQKLHEILRYSKWSQEQLAYNLGVSFSTLNAWINGKANPRSKALRAIDATYLDVVGRVVVDSTLLKEAKRNVSSRRISAKQIVENEQLLDKITLFLTYHTNTIEGSTMTLADVREVLSNDNRVLANKTAREQTEARNHRSALFFLLDELNSLGERFTWTEDIILNIHLRLMNTIISDAGSYRRGGVRIMGSPIALANFVKIPDLMNEFVASLNQPADDTISKIARLHAEFERIHPFSDGNGRTGRLIMFIQALQCNLLPPLILKERKHAYYKYLEIAQSGEKYDPLILFVAESMLATGDLIDK